MGNAKSGCFVHPAIPVLLRERVVPAADVITPNQFELGFLTGTEPPTLEDDPRLGRPGPRDGPVAPCWSPASSARTATRSTIEMLAVDDAGAWIVQTPLLPMKANGSGDVTAALFTAHLHETGSIADALGRTVSSVFDLLQTTLDSGERELQLVESQETFAHPAASSSRRRSAEGRRPSRAEPVTGIEPATSSLQEKRSTN